MSKKTVSLEVGTWNSHVGTALRDGGLAWLMKQEPDVDVWLLQEVPDRATLLKHGVDEKEWHLVVPKREPGGGVDSVILARKSRLKPLTHASPNISHGETNERGKPRPRHRTTARFRDLRTGRITALGSMHVHPLGKGLAGAAAGARKIHVAQVAEWAKWAKGRTNPEAVVILGGDGNERLLAKVPARLAAQSLPGQLEVTGLRFAHTQHDGGAVELDDIANRDDPFVKVTDRRSHVPPAKGNDHAAVVVAYAITPRKGWKAPKPAPRQEPTYQPSAGMLAAIGRAAAAVTAHTNIGVGNCGMRVRETAGAVTSLGATALLKWAHVEQHPTTDWDKVPNGCIVWGGPGSSGAGHVAYKDEHGRLLSPGTPHDPDHWGYLPNWDALIAQGWTKDRLIGWSPDIDGTRP